MERLVPSHSFFIKRMIVSSVIQKVPNDWVDEHLPKVALGTLSAG